MPTSHERRAVISPYPGRPALIEEAEPNARLAMTVVTGFLGAGKTTLVNRVLGADHGLRLAVVVNEFGEIGIDGSLIARQAGPITELVNGCLCCVNRGALAATVTDLIAAAQDLDGVIVETSGLADPLGVADLVAQGAFARDLALDAVITVVDCENFDANLTHATAAYQQLVAADLLVLNKADLVDELTVQRLHERLTTLNADASIVAARRANLPVDLVLQAPATRRNRRSTIAAVDHDGGIETISLTADCTADRGLFLGWIESLPSAVVRVKGLLRFDDDPLVHAVHRVGARYDIVVAPQASPRGDSAQAQILVLGRDLDMDELTRGFRACLRSPRGARRTPLERPPLT